jgi:isopentenyl diphosphate isomerase/L-lactate dehydrogenase-like FMN-dependent dehydrogenase
VNRRSFLATLAAGPALPGQESSEVITDPKQAINVMDFEAAARQILPPAHFGYMATGVDDDATLRANREGFNRIYLRPRRLVDINRADLRTELFGTVWDTPIALAPIGNQKAFHGEGEIPVAGAAREKRTLQILSTMANTSIEEISKIRGGPVWYQLYTTSKWEITEKLIRRVEAAGCPVVCLTVDTQAGRRVETFERSKLLDKRDCNACHGTTRESFYRRKAMFQGISMAGEIMPHDPGLTWKHVRRIKKLSGMKLLIKGIETAEDAKLCVENGLDGVVVSNHGGRAGESGRGTIECLPEVIQAVAGRIPVLVDGGFRRGTDIFKALALGARAVCIGRPYIWGLAAFGQPGVERVLDLLRIELELVMKQCGTPSIAEISRSSIGFR